MPKNDYQALQNGQFVDDGGEVHDLIPSTVIASVPAAKDAAERYGREVRFDFLDDRAVLHMLYRRSEDTGKAGVLGCLFVLPLFVFGAGAWPFWDLVASQKPRPFQIGFIVAEAVIVGGLLLALFLLRRRSLLDKTNRNTRCRARLYRKIVVIARNGGADIPLLYPYYGMYATSRKFYPEAPEHPVPSLPEGNNSK
ncbi:hypothetical protein JQK87_16325 [Streptomyces sp. G44]|uniref:hypothetical protein n=1 Tax=Streptomyces sp. G44 TaxID=2807632 RepID=UPI001960276B|nr:hypothetical protein [Streptomyces sp. G44]MBM7169955.1 hypothetical protein [Streptomyces sp. G44]